MEVQSQFYK